MAYAEWHMLNVVMMNVNLLCVVMLNVVMQNVLLLKVVMLNAIILSVSILCVDRLNVVAAKKRLRHKGEERLGRLSLNFFVVIYYSVSVKLVCLTSSSLSNV
jgi:hypothetical protein